MPRSVRAALVGLLAFLAVSALAAQARAVLTAQPVSPSGAYTAVAVGNVLFSLLSTGVALTCTSSRLGYTLSSNGTGTSPAGSLVQSGCTNPVLGAYTFTQSSAWAVRAVAELLASPPTDVLIGFDFTLPARGLQIAASGCTYTVSGSFTIGKLFVLPIRRTITTTDQLTTLDLTKQSLVVDSLTGAACSLLGLRVGLAWSYRATYVFNRSFTVG